MSETMQDKNEKKAQNLQAPASISEIYADGAASISIRQNVAKIDFYQASPIENEEGSDKQRELRKVFHRLVMPVSGLSEIHEILNKMMEKKQGD